jgi:hypothetical protein
LDTQSYIQGRGEEEERKREASGYSPRGTRVEEERKRAGVIERAGEEEIARGEKVGRGGGEKVGRGGGEE